MVVYPEKRYDFRSEVTSKSSAIYVQCFHHIVVVRDVEDARAEFEDVEIPPKPMLLKQADGTYVEIPRPQSKPVIERRKVKDGYEGVSVYDGTDEEVVDIMRQVSWDFKVRRGSDAMEEYLFLVHYPDIQAIEKITYHWSGGAEVGLPLSRVKCDYDKILNSIHNVHDGARIDHAPGFTDTESKMSIEDMRKALDEHDRKVESATEDKPKGVGFSL
tara:strand:- start:16144 stop:16791 length:648 start_codon:yes stop_codon:yes gene_type:complete